MPNKQINLTVTEEPVKHTRTLFILTATPAILGEDDDAPDLCCGKCEAVLLRRLDASRIPDVVLRCRCGAFNDTGLGRLST